MPATEYDQLAYKTGAFPKAHPNRLAVVARLAGLPTAALETARILELGCGDGTHLAWVAATLPNAQCVGVDLSSAAIDTGLAAAARAGLTNLSLRALDVMAIDAAFGQFDFIISHGLFSWVPDAVRAQILRICQTNLAPDGVAYISFNALPENAFRDLARMVMRSALTDTDRVTLSPSDQLKIGRAALKAVADGAEGSEQYRSVMRAQSERVEETQDYLLFHDDFAPFQKAFYFTEFAQMAASNGLDFLGDAELGDSALALSLTRSGEVARQFGRTRVEREQWLDFKMGRAFRSALLVHTGKVIPDHVSDADVSGFRIAGDVRYTVPNDIVMINRTKVTFRGGTGSAMTTDEPLVKSALHLLQKRAPASISFAEMKAAVLMATAEADNDYNHERLREFVVRAVALGMIELYLTPDAFTLTPGAQPYMHPMTRSAVAQTGIGISLTGKPVNAEDPPIRHFASLLDGTRDRTALTAAMRAFLTEHKMPLPEADMMERIMDNGLEVFAKSGALIS